MPRLIWNSSLSVNVQQFDQEHQKLVSMINELHDAMSVGKGKEVLGKILDSLIQYTLTHFAGEEKVMAANGYPQLKEHIVEHQKLTAKVLEVQSELKAGRAGLTIPVMNFLNDWLTKHIQQTDKKYGAHLNAKGIR